MGVHILFFQIFGGLEKFQNKKTEGKYFFLLYTILFLRGGLANISYFLSHYILRAIMT